MGDQTRFGDGESEGAGDDASMTEDRISKLRAASERGIRGPMSTQLSDRSGVRTWHSPGEDTIVIPAGHVVYFTIVGGGGAGGNWGSHNGGTAKVLTGVIGVEDHDYPLQINCGQGGQVDPDASGGGPAQGGAGGAGHVPGGDGGWGSNWAAGGGGGGGGASAVYTLDRAIHIVAPGGGGAGGGSTPSDESSALPGETGQDGRSGSTANGGTHVGMSPAGGKGTTRVGGSGGYGTTALGEHGGGGGGGGGGWGGGGGGSGGSGGGRGGAGGCGAYVATGTIATVAVPVDETDPTSDIDPADVAGAGGRGGPGQSDAADEAGMDIRLGRPGRDGMVELRWEQPERLSFTETPDSRSEKAVPGPPETRRPRRSSKVLDTTTGDQLRLSRAVTAPVLEGAGGGARVWKAFDGARTVGQVAGVLTAANGYSYDENLGAVSTVVDVMESRGFLDPGPSTVDHIELTAPWGFGYDLVGDRYTLAGDPTGRPQSADLLLAVLPDGSAPRHGLERVVDELRNSVGPNHTVWAAKHLDGRIRFEFYLFGAIAGAHDDGAHRLLASASDTVRRLSGWDAPTKVARDAVLVSFEIDIGGDGGISTPETIDVSHKLGPDSGLVLNYEQSTDRNRLKSVSQGFLTASERPQLATRLGFSRDVAADHRRHVRKFWLDRIDARKHCHRCWVSSKTDSDGVYLNGVHVDDLVGFLDEFDYPAHLRSWTRENASRLDHLRFDLAFDYHVADGQVSINRTGFCGYF